VLGGVEGRSLRSRREAAGYARPWHRLRAPLGAGYRVAGRPGRGRRGRSRRSRSGSRTPISI